MLGSWTKWNTHLTLNSFWQKSYDELALLFVYPRHDLLYGLSLHFCNLKKRRYACELFSATFLFDTSLKGVMLRSSHIVEEIKPRTSTFVPLNLGSKVRQRDEISEVYRFRLILHALLLIKFRLSEKATKIWKNLPHVLMLLYSIY